MHAYSCIHTDTDIHTYLHTYRHTYPHNTVAYTQLQTYSCIHIVDRNH